MGATEHSEAKRPFLERFALHRPELRAWALYDWANSAFWLTVITVVFPLYYLELTKGVFEEGSSEPVRYYSLATTIAIAAVALIAPLLGTYADLYGLRKRLLALFAGIGVLATAGLFFVMPGQWVLGLVLFGVANLGVAGSVVFYDALLPHVASPEETHRLSTSGFALGYVGSGLLLVANFLWISKPEWIGLPSYEDVAGDVAAETFPTRLALLSVAVWWGVFTLPLLRRVSEPPADGRQPHETGSAFHVSWTRLLGTMRDLMRYRQAVRLLVAFLIFNDGIVTLVRMASLYASDRDIERNVVLGSILLLQFIGVPFALLFGALADRVGAKRMVLFGLATYCVASVCAYFMSLPWHFVGLAVLIGVVQGGTQGLARSMFARMIPLEKSGQFFAFFAVGEKFAGIFGPLLFTLVIAWTGDVQPAVLVLIAFFLVGGLLLTRVDESQGIREARAG